MAGRIIYLEIDDEITSAAARIRDADAARLALVLPYGSRVATSRINFRLLSRDALTHNKRLSIVAGDPATRALAASAGLPVFSSVAEYETAEGGVEALAPADEGGGQVAEGALAAAALAGNGEEVSTPAADEDVAPAPAADEAVAPTPVVDEPVDDLDASDGTLGLVVPAAIASAAATNPATQPVVTDTVRSVPRPEPAVTPGPVGAATAERGGPATVAPTRGVGGSRIRTPWLIGGGILVLAVLLGAVGLYVLLPSATIVVTPQPEAVGPIELTVVADPNATQPDPAGNVVPAQQITVPVSVQDTFQATGKRVELTRATGEVRFENRDPTSTNRVAAGSIVRTGSGVRFRTDQSILVPRAELVGLTIFPARATVGITAVDGGPEGNVEAGTITIVPNDENGLFLKVTNPEPTSGGARQEFTRVTDEDVAAAMATLETSLEAQFQEKLADPSLAAGGATVITSTGVLGEATPTVPPDGLVGREVATFDLGLSADGTVIAVDTAPVQTIAEEALTGAVDADHQLIAGSTDIDVGDAVVNGQSVSFPVTATAQQIAILDPAELRALVLGKPVDEARRILEPYGEVELTVSPDWSGSVPGFESRVDLTVRNPVEIASPAPSSSAAP
jgi:hypothetical protein